MSKREELISEVKELYGSYAASETQNHFHKTTTGLTPEAYYQTLENKVIDEISHGTFDNCRTGKEITNKVAADKTILSSWEV